MTARHYCSLLLIVVVLFALSACLRAPSTPQPVTIATAAPNPSPTRTAVVQPGNPSPTSAPRPPVQATRLTGIAKDVTYCTMDGFALKMDLYPPPPTDVAVPVVVYVHGGGWRAGDKTGGEAALFAPLLTARGYMFASINYRLAPMYRWPAMIHDVKCAIRFLRAHAQSYNLDPNRVGTIGASAGGHLVALLGVTDKSAGFDVGEYPEQSSRVQAVVDLFGPANLVARDFSLGQAPLAQEVFGIKSAEDPILKQASPINYVTNDDSPFLLLHGDKDTLVPLSQSQELYERLKGQGVPARLVVVKNAGHGFAPSGGQISPTLAELGVIVAQFFDRELSGK